MIVLKFGGSSVGSPERIRVTIDIIKEYLDKGTEISVVFSAFKGVTDNLISLADQAAVRNDNYRIEFVKLKERHQEVMKDLLGEENERVSSINNKFDELESLLLGVYLTQEITNRTLDYILSFGEYFSCSIISETLISDGIKCDFLDAGKVIVTDDNFGCGRVNFTLTDKKITNYFSKYPGMKIITGFNAATINNETTTLGRGGSDYTASIIGSALNAEEIHIWTDVDGIMTADPGKVIDSYPLKAVTYEEATELSHFGAKVIHPPTMKPALKKNIRIRIKNSFNSGARGTIILERQKSVKFNAKGISSINEVSMLRISGSGMIGLEDITAKIFSAFVHNKIKIVMVSQGSSGDNISLALMPEDVQKAVSKLEDVFRLELMEGTMNKIEVMENLSIIAVVGEDLQDTPAIAGKVFQSLGRNGINIVAISQGSSRLNVSLVIHKDKLRKALNVLHSALFLSKQKILNLFLVGPGQVGKTLLGFINKEYKRTKKDLNTRIKVVGIINSKKMLLERSGINPDNWKEQLEDSGHISNLETFVSEMIRMNIANPIFVDCTAGDKAVNLYEQILDASISIVTPNKIANSLNTEFYESIRKKAKKNNVIFSYSTNVAAGLPIISIIQNMVRCGDRITKIEGILSGSLAYIFNSFRQNRKFSEVLIEAGKNGFLEPDPRDDLGGVDFARKLLILIREAGYEMEIDDISVENILPEELLKIEDVNRFWEVLPDYDDYFDELKNKDSFPGSRIIYSGIFSDNKAELKIERITESHPFYSSDGAENVIAVYSDRYSINPLVIKGDGAGAELTASGIFADILHISNHLGLTYG